MLDIQCAHLLLKSTYPCFTLHTIIALQHLNVWGLAHFYIKNRLVLTPVGLSTLYYSNLIFNASANKCGKSVLLCRPANRSAWGPNAYNGTSVPVCSVLVPLPNALPIPKTLFAL